MARYANTFLFLYVQEWLVTTPPGAPTDGYAVLVGTGGTGAFAGKDGNVAVWVAIGTPAWKFIATTALLSGVLYRHDVAGNIAYYGHDGTAPIGPFLTAAAASAASIQFTAQRRFLCRMTAGAGPGEEGVIDLDGTLASNSDDRLASQKAVKTYVDAVATGLRWKSPVVVATTAAGTLATSFENGDTIDGIVLVTADRILIKDQAAGAENGVYTVNASGAPTRAADADAGAELPSAAVFVLKGTVNADKAFVCTNDTITLGTTPIVFTAFTSVIGALNEAEVDARIAAMGWSTAFFTQSIDTGVGAASYGLASTIDGGSTYGGIAVPNGKTMDIIRAAGVIAPGATVGSNYDLWLIAWSGIGGFATDLVSALDQSNDTVAIFAAEGAPLVSFVGPDNVKIGWRVAAGSTGALANKPHSCEIWYRFIDS